MEQKKTARYSVLVVDDEPGIRRMLIFALDPKDFEVLEAGDGLQALERLQRGRFHLVVTDMKMPNMDGMELLREAKRKYPDVKVIMMTGYGTAEAEAAAFREGAYGFVRKPFDMDKFCALLGKALAEIKRE